MYVHAPIAALSSEGLQDRDQEIATASDTETNEPLQQASTEPLPEQVQATAVESVETNESIVVQQRRGLLDQKLVKRN